ncbi:hypothetical protein ACHAXS_002585 [Conticribra weissflogii]
MKFVTAISSAPFFLAFPTKVASHSFAKSVKALIDGIKSESAVSGARCRPNLGDVEDCPRGEYCSADPGVCFSAGYEGTCTPIGSACPSTYEPVCGCDGVTYGNRCEASGAYVSIQYEGECTDTACMYGSYECYNNEYCAIDDGACKTYPGIIFVVCWRHISKFERLHPITTFDAQSPFTRFPAIRNNGGIQSAVATTKHTRTNAKQTQRERASHTKECATLRAASTMIPTTVMETSGVTSLLESASTMDTSSANAPKCQILALLIIRQCGCDGVTYANECSAGAAGVNVWYKGECTEDSDSAISNEK